ncbi:MAG: thioredoxin family protein [Caloramator sp.]|nr:thioredoxin family protein [Caloramator sp.]
MDLTKALSFEEYLNDLTEEQKEIYLKFYNNTFIDEKNIASIKNIKETLNLIVFSEGYCPDCLVTLPVIKRIMEINEKINVYIFKRYGNENMLLDMVGEARIPTILLFDKDLQPRDFYIEFPKEFKEKLVDLKEDEKKLYISQFRQGKYIKLIEKEIIKILKDLAS